MAWQNFQASARVVAPDGQHGAVAQSEGTDAQTGEPLYTVIFDDGVSAGIFLDSQLAPEAV